MTNFPSLANLPIPKRHVRAGAKIKANLFTLIKNRVPAIRQTGSIKVRHKKFMKSTFLGDSRTHFEVYANN